jgi:hypothetical protein
VLYNSAHRTLRALDPRNPQLVSASTETWIPTNRDIIRLNDEIARVRYKRGLSDLEPHHTLPRQFSAKFNKHGIDIEHYVIFMPRGPHRLRPDGMHTGPDNWNAQWRRFFYANPNATPDEIFEHANSMLKQLPR